MRPLHSFRSGFTLLEILLVLVLLSLSAVAVIASIPPKQDNQIKEEAQRLFQRLQLFNEEAMLSGKDFGIRVDEEQRRYVFLELKPEGWEKIALKKIPEETTLPDGLTIRLDLSSGVWGTDDRLFEPTSLFDEDMFADVEKTKKPEKPPQIFILSSGEFTPGVFVLAPKNQAKKTLTWHVQIKENGVVQALDDRDWNDEKR